MKKFKIFSILLVCFTALCMVFATCEFDLGEEEDDDNNGGTSGGGTSGGGGTSQTSAASLTENIWADGSINVPNGEAWYSFTAAANTTYRIWWNDSSDGDRTKTVDVRVTAYDSNRTQLFADDNAWSSPSTITLLSSGMIYLKVTPYYTGNTGTFAIGYSTDNVRKNLRIRPPANPILLTASQWTDGSINTSNSEVWYSFTAVANTTYGVWWNDNVVGDRSKTLDVSVRAYDSNGSELFDVDSSWTFNLASTINTASGGTVYLRVLPNSRGNTGTFGIIYGTGFVRPDIGTTQLTAGQWMDGSIGIWGETWYSFTITANTTYRIWWNDSSDGDRTKTVDVRVTAYDSNRTQLFADDNAWSSPSTITLLSSGMIYLRVTPYYTGGSGTFAVVYSTNNTRPTVLQ